MKQNKQTWQQELAEGFSHIYELFEYLNLSMSTDELLISSSFPLRVPRKFAIKIEKGNINDPLLKQILPISAENKTISGFINDPVGDVDAIAETGVIHKYQDRVLLITTGSCAINCRYCFRKNFPYTDFQLSTQKQNQAIQYIKNNQKISEVILSGGDPLLLSDQKIFSLLRQLDEIKQLKRIRIHSRIPIVLPSRITLDFCQQLSTLSKQVVLVVHANHNNELCNDVKRACKRLLNVNVTLLNQSVLLKGINDNAQQLCVLNEKLFAFGVLPYYLHLLDKTTGTSHFEVKQKPAIALMNQIKKQLPGYLVPKLVREQVGASSKIMIT